MQILEAIKSSEGIKDAINAAVEGLVVQHCAFVVSPSHEDRSLVSCLVEPISKYAMDAIIMTLDEHSADAAFNLYNSIQGFPLADTFRRKIWERKVHGYFRQTASLELKIRSLDDMSTCILKLPKDVKHFDFRPPKALADEIAQCVLAAGKSDHLQLTLDNFSSLDSIIYQPTGALVNIQITDALIHPIQATGLSALQELLVPKDVSLSPIRPSTVEKPWILLFVVPRPLEESFIKQDIAGAASWSQPIEQYVLGLDLHQVFCA